MNMHMINICISCFGCGLYLIRLEAGTSGVADNTRSLDLKNFSVSLYISTVIYACA